MLLRVLAISLCLSLVLAKPRKADATPKQQSAPAVKKHVNEPAPVISKVQPPAPVKKQADNSTWNKPDYCRTIDCPVFTIIQTNEEESWEHRRYESAMWVSTDFQAMMADYDQASGDAFNRLFEYISGENSRNEVVDMTAPVITKVMPGEGPNCNSYFTMSFYVPYALQSNPPAPTSADVYLEMHPAVTLYAEWFSGFAEIEDYIAKTIELSESIGGTDQHVTSFYYTAGYDSPFEAFDRHNEAWLLSVNQTDVTH